MFFRSVANPYEPLSNACGSVLNSSKLADLVTYGVYPIPGPQAVLHGPERLYMQLCRLLVLVKLNPHLFI